MSVHLHLQNVPLDAVLRADDSALRSALATRAARDEQRAAAAVAGAGALRLARRAETARRRAELAGRLVAQS